ncbi:hypothetical protein ES708_15755 [subsurface metagenome]
MLIKALKFQSYSRNPKKQVHLIRAGIIFLISTGMIFLGDYLSSSGISTIFIMEEYPGSSTAIFTILGIILILIGFLLLGFTIYPLITRVLIAFFSPFIKEMSKIAYRNILRNRKRTRNTFAILSIGLCLLITLGSITSSFYEGGEITAQIMYAGDMKVNGVPFPYDQSSSIENIEGIDGVCHYIENVPHVKIDGSGGGNKTDGSAEYVSLSVIDVNDYYQTIQSIMPQSIQFSQQYEWDDIMVQFQMGGFVILDTISKVVLEKEVGEVVEIEYSIGVVGNFTILAYMDDLPGLPGFLFSNDEPTDSGIGLHALIAWGDYEENLRDAFGTVDILIENSYKDHTGSRYEENWGKYLDWFNYTQVNASLTSIPGISGMAPRIMFPAFDKYWAGFEAMYLSETLKLSFIEEEYLANEVNGTWVNTGKSLVAIDPEKDYIIGSAQLLEVNETAKNAGMGSTIEKLLSFFDKSYPTIQACVVGKYWSYGNSTNWHMTINQHYAGEILKINGNQYTVVGVLDCAEQYWKPNYLSVELGQSEGFYMDAYAYPSAQFRNNDNLYFSLQTARHTLFNQTTHPSIFYTHSYQYLHGDITALFLELEVGVDVETIAETIRIQFASVPELENLTIFNLEEALNRSGAFHVSYFLRLEEDMSQDQVISRLKEIYYSQGLMLTEADISTTVEYMEEGYVMLKLVLSILTFLLGFSFLVSVFGQIISVLISIQHRTKEIGTFRALGTSANQIMKLIMAESVIIGLIGLLIGLGSGLFTSVALLYDIPFNPVIGFIFVLPVEYIGIIAAILFSVVLLSSIIPVRYTMKIEIVDAIRKRD